MSAADAVIYDIYNDSNYKFSGIDSGYNTKIICKDGNICNIICYNNGCNKLTLECENGDNGCIFNVSCDYAEMSSICPNGMLN